MPKSKPAKSSAAQRTLVTFVLDNTQSMQKIKSSTIESFNTYLTELKRTSAPIDFTLITFNRAAIEKVHFEVPVKDVPELDDATYRPQAATPLIEAATKTIRALEAALPNKADQPKVVVAIQTDGEENTSHPEYTWAGLKSLIEEKQKAGWQFLFMGAGIDAYDQGSKMGIAASNTMSYDHLDKGATRAAFAASASNTADFASGLRSHTMYSGAQKVAAKDQFDPANKKPTAGITGVATFGPIGGAGVAPAYNVDLTGGKAKTPADKSDLTL